MSDIRRSPTTTDGGLIPPPVSPAGASGAGSPAGADGEQKSELERLVGWFDERTGAAGIARGVMRKVFPDHWSFLLGEVAAFCLIVLVATGTFLTFFFRPDTTPVTYTGSYAPLQGQQVSAAFNSVMTLSFDVRAGLLMRQIHHWTALIFIGVIALHMTRIFFTGAFRRPREINWVIGFGLLLMAMAEGITGYSLPDDLLSGVGLRIVYSVAEGIPLIGPWLAFLIFGGPFPSDALISRLFVLHIMLLPGLLIGAVTVHILIVYIQKHTQFPGRGRTNFNVVGAHLWPGQAFRSVGLFFLTAAMLSFVGGTFQVNPVWNYGPYLPYAATSPAQPDWYVGWLEGALRMGPNIEPTILGVTIPSPFVPGIVLPGLLFTLMLLWPFIEPHLTHDFGEHNVLDLPWDRPARTALGAAVLSIFGVLTLAGGNDILSVFFHIPVETLTVVNRILLFAAPVVTFLVVYALMREWRRRGAAPLGPRAGVVLRRRPDGGFEEVEA